MHGEPRGGKRRARVFVFVPRFSARPFTMQIEEKMPGRISRVVRLISLHPTHIALCSSRSFLIVVSLLHSWLTSMDGARDFCQRKHWSLLYWPPRQAAITASLSVCASIALPRAWFSYWLCILFLLSSSVSTFNSFLPSLRLNKCLNSRESKRRKCLCALQHYSVLPTRSLYSSLSLYFRKSSE